MAGTSGTPFSSAGGGFFRETQKKDPNSRANYLKAVEKDLQNKVKEFKKELKKTLTNKPSKSDKTLGKLARRNSAGTS